MSADRLENVLEYSCEIMNASQAFLSFSWSFTVPMLGLTQE